MFIRNEARNSHQKYWLCVRIICWIISLSMSMDPCGSGIEYKSDRDKSVWDRPIGWAIIVSMEYRVKMQLFNCFIVGFDQWTHACIWISIINRENYQNMFAECNLILIWERICWTKMMSKWYSDVNCNCDYNDPFPYQLMPWIEKWWLVSICRILWTFAYESRIRGHTETKCCAHCWTTVSKKNFEDFGNGTQKRIKYANNYTKSITQSHDQTFNQNKIANKSNELFMRRIFLTLYVKYSSSKSRKNYQFETKLVKK